MGKANDDQQESFFVQQKRANNIKASTQVEVEKTKI